MMLRTMGPIAPCYHDDVCIHGDVYHSVRDDGERVHDEDSLRSIQAQSNHNWLWQRVMTILTFFLSLKVNITATV